MGDVLSLLTELAEGPAVGDLMVWTDVSDTTQAASGTTKKNEARFGVGTQVNAQTGTTYTYLTTDFRKLVTHTNGSAIAGTLPQAGASFPAGWYMFVQNRGAGALTITPTTSTIDGAASLTLSQNEGAIVVSDGTNYFTLRGKATGAAGVGDVVGPGSATDNALARFDSTTGKIIQDSTITLDDVGALTVPEMAAPSTPAAGKVSVYAKSDGKLYIKDDAGTETDLTADGGAEAGANSDITSMDGLTGALQYPTQIDFTEGAAPGTPAAGKVSLYAKTDGLLYSKDDAGAETALGGGGAGYAGVTTGGTGSLDFAQGAKIADEPFIDGSVEWNAGAVTFTAIKIGVTDTASATASKLLDLLVGGSTKFSVRKSGTIVCGSGASNDFAISPTGDTNTGIVFNNSDAIHFYNGGSLLHQFTTTEYICGGSGGVRVGDSQYFRFTNSTKLTCDSNRNGILAILTNGNTGGTLAILPRTQSQFTGDVNNYAPTDSQAYFQRWSSDASRTVTGYQSWNTSGEWKLIVNIGSNDIVLAHESASSTAANRFLCSTGADITLSAGQAADIIYDNTTQRWRVFKRN